jgi:DNA-binding LytR/AlgR family response regulator
MFLVTHNGIIYGEIGRTKRGGTLKHLDIAIVEDNSVERKFLADSIHQWAKDSKCAINLKEYAHAEPLLFRLTQAATFDLFLIDINLSGISGMELAEKLRDVNDKSIIVFTTALRKFIHFGYEVNAYRYLVKPIRYEDLVRVLDYAVDSASNWQKNSFLISTKEKQQRIAFGDIHFIETTKAHWLCLHLKDGTEVFRGNISEICELLPKDRFVRVHRSCIVNLSYVAQIAKGQLTMSDDTILPLSRNYQKEVSMAMISYYGGSL